MEAASVEGKEFTRERVAALAGDGSPDPSAPCCAALVRKDLIRPMGPDADTFRFRHQLIRDAAYEGMPKELRAGLHERFADWLEARPSAFPVIIDELLGYHVERAVRLRRELGETDEATATLASRASAHLGAAGLRAAQRDDPAAASTLFERATTLVGTDDAPRGALLPALGASLFEAGRIPEAVAILDEAIERAPEARLDARARIEREFVRLESEASAATAHARRRPTRPSRCSSARVTTPGNAGPGTCGRRPCGSPGARARPTAPGARRRLCAQSGRRPRAVPDPRHARDRQRARTHSGRRRDPALPGVPRPRRRESGGRGADAQPAGVAARHAGRVRARGRLLREANETLDQLGSMGWVSHHEALVGCSKAARRWPSVPLREGVEQLASMSDGELLATTLAMLAQAVYAQGQLAEAEQLCRMAADAGAAEDLVTQVIWRGVDGQGARAGGRPKKPRALPARRLRSLRRPTCSPITAMRCSTSPRCWDDFPERRVSERLQAALYCYERKGNVIGAARARSLLANRVRGT